MIAKVVTRLEGAVHVLTDQVLGRQRRRSVNHGDAVGGEKVLGPSPHAPGNDDRAPLLSQLPGQNPRGVGGRSDLVASGHLAVLHVLDDGGDEAVFVEAKHGDAFLAAIGAQGCRGRPVPL